MSNILGGKMTKSRVVEEHRSRSFLESEDAVKANIKVKNPMNGEESLYRNVVRSFPNYHSNYGRFPGYLYHYKKMNFLLKTIADCNYVAFELILDKLDINNKKHKDLLMGYINLKHNTVEKRAFGGGRKRELRVELQIFFVSHAS